MTCMLIIIPDHEIYEYTDNIILILSCIPEISYLEKQYVINNRGGSRIWPWGAKISSEASYIYMYERSELRVKRV